MEDAICDSSLKSMPQKRLNLIYGSISSYSSNLNSTERLCMIEKENGLACVLCDIESNRLGLKEYRNKRVMEA